MSAFRPVRELGRTCRFLSCDSPSRGRERGRAWTRLCLLAAVIAAPTGAAGGPELFDAHIHYSLDAREYLSAEEALARMRAAGISHALVSSSGDKGTQELYALAPELVIPSLRPYRAPGESTSWMHDDSVVEFVEQRLDNGRYAAIGEFHVYGSDVELPIVVRMIELAGKHGLPLHVHGDSAAIEGIFRRDFSARVLWAHAGFEPANEVDRMMRRYPALWAELSLRSEVAGDQGVSDAWRTVLTTHADRFLVGTDTYTPWRWDDVQAHARWVREWLSALPPEVAKKIAHENGRALFRDWLESVSRP